MKIYFGFPNPDTIDKLSPALQAKDINLLKAQPSQILLKGLYRIEQPGYASYASHLPAFLYATDRKKRTPLGREGYPIITKPQDVIPLPIPAICVSYKNSDIPKTIKEFTVVKEITAKDKSLKTYLVDYKHGLFGILKASKFETNQFPIANSVSADDLPTLFNILRIFSSFLRVHKYPAFTDGDAFEHEFETRMAEETKELKRTEYEANIAEEPERKMVAIEVDGEMTWVKPRKSVAGASVKLHYAKPVDDLSTKAWGSTTDIPNTDGIVFPFEEDLAVWDKEMVCAVIGRYFVRCLGFTTDGCLKGYSDLCQSWKRSLYRTSIGHVLSHLAKVIDLAIPSQARVFPVIESGKYTGAYLSGSGYSVALRGEIFRPTGHANNSEDFSAFDGPEEILRKICGMFTDGVDEAYQKLMTKKGHLSMRGLQVYLNTWVISPAKWSTIRSLASRLSYPQEFLRINMENIRLVLSWIKGEAPIPITAPMHSYGLGKTSLFELSLSAFGPNAPSPSIPGAPKVQLTDKMPANFSKPLTFRTTALENAIADWVEVGLKGFTYNGPERLSGRYQYVSVRGDEERKGWFEALHGYHVWYKSEGKKMSGEVVENPDDETASGGISLGEQSVNLDGF